MKIVVRVEGATRQVKVKRLEGCLALHESVVGSGNISITHLASGLAVAYQSIHTPYRVIKPLVKRLHRIMRGVINPLDMDAESRAEVKAVRDAIEAINKVYEP